MILCIVPLWDQEGGKKKPQRLEWENSDGKCHFSGLLIYFALGEISAN